MSLLNNIITIVGLLTLVLSPLAISILPLILITNIWIKTGLFLIFFSFWMASMGLLFSAIIQATATPTINLNVDFKKK